VAVAPAWVDIRTPPTVGEPDGLICAYSGAVVEVSDVDRAVRFYSDLLGFRAASPTGGGPTLRLSELQTITLVPRPSPRVIPESGIHQAYAFPRREVEQIVARLEAAGVQVHRYHEDREVERRDDRYCFDPDGNRVQLVVGTQRGLDHAVVETHDLEWSEVFYTHVLGGRVEMRVGWRMEDFARAWSWGSGEDQCAPGTRRWDKLYTDEKALVPRPSAQLFVAFAPKVTFGIYLANEHRQEPPRGHFRGSPSVGFLVQPGRMNELERRLREIRLRCMDPSRAFGGPFERAEGALFVRDPSGNFLEFRER